MVTVSPFTVTPEPDAVALLPLRVTVVAPAALQAVSAASGVALAARAAATVMSAVPAGAVDVPAEVVVERVDEEAPMVTPDPAVVQAVRTAPVARAAREVRRRWGFMDVLLGVGMRAVQD